MGPEQAAEDWLQTIAPQPGRVFRAQRPERTKKQQNAYDEVYEQTRATAIAQQVGAAYGAPNLALLILKLGDPFGVMAAPKTVLQVAKARIEAKNPPAAILATITRVLEYVSLMVSSPECKDDRERQTTQLNAPLVHVWRSCPHKPSDRHWELIDRFANDCAHILAQGRQSEGARITAHAVMRYFRLMEPDGVGPLNELHDDIITRLDEGRVHSFPSTRKTRRSHRARTISGATRPSSFAGSGTGGRRGQQAGSDEGDAQDSRRTASTARAAPWAGEPAYDREDPPLALLEETATDYPEDEALDDGMAARQGKRSHEHLADLPSDSSSHCLPGSVLGDVVSFITSAAGSPCDATITAVSRAAAIFLSLFLGIPMRHAVSTRCGCEPSHHDVIYDPHNHLLYVPMSPLLTRALSNPEQGAGVGCLPIHGNLSIRPPAGLCALLSLCADKAAQALAQAPSTDEDVAQALFLVDDPRRGLRQLWLTDVKTACGHYNRHLSVRIAPGHFAAALQALILRHDSPVPPSILPFLNGEAGLWWVAISYLTLSLDDLDRWSDRLYSYVLSHICMRQERSGHSNPQRTQAWLSDPDHALTHARLMSRPGYVGSRFRPEIPSVAAHLRYLRSVAHSARLFGTQAEKIEAWGNLLGCELRLFVGLRTQDVEYLTYRNIVSLADTLALSVMMKPNEKGLERPRLLYLPRIVRTTLEHYMTYTSDLHNTDHPLLSTTAKRGAGLPHPDRCRELLASYITEIAEELAGTNGSSIEGWSTAWSSIGVVGVVLLTQLWMGHDLVTGFGRHDDGLDEPMGWVMDRAAIRLNALCEA